MYDHFFPGIAGKPESPQHRRLAWARFCRASLFLAGLLFCGVVYPYAIDFNQQTAKGQSADGVFWFGMALITISQIKAIEVAVRERQS